MSLLGSPIDTSVITKGVCHAFMTDYATKHRRAGETVEKAYDRLLQTDATMKSVYQIYKVAPRDAQDAELKKGRSGKQKLEAEIHARLMAAAKKYQANNGGTLAEALRHVSTHPDIPGDG